MHHHRAVVVSMKSGLEGRNNDAVAETDIPTSELVSMKSGLEGRNNKQFDKVFDQYKTSQ